MGAASARSRLNLGRLRAFGLGEQALKAALAAGLAWSLGGLVPGAPPQPYLAPLTAVLTVQLTIADSVAGAVQRTLGVSIGVVVALLASSAVGVNPLSVAALVLVAQAIAALLRLNVVGTSQVIVTALLVLTIGGATSLAFGWARVAETVVGALVGVGVNALLAPPSYLPAAQAAAQALVETLGEELDALATALASGLTAEVAGARLDHARQVVRQFHDNLEVLARAEQSLRFNLLAASERDQLDVYRASVESLEHTAIQVRSLTRSLFDAVTEPDAAWIEPGMLGRPLADLVRAAGQVLAAFAAGGDLAAARASFASCREQLTRRAQATPSLLLAGGWEQLGSMLATLDRLVEDLGSGGSSRED